MKLSIWQQFSSNHSAAFTVIGKFKTAADAERVGRELKAMLAAIGWARTAAMLGSQEVEKQFQQQYGLPQWGELEYITDPTTAPEIVKTYDNLVFVAEDFIGRYTWAGEEPFDVLLAKLGGEVAVDSELLIQWIRCIVTANAPDQASLDAIRADVTTETEVYGGESVSYLGLGDVFVQTSNGIIIDDVTEGTFEVDGLRLTIAFQLMDHGREIIRLFDNLKARDCTDIDITFETVL